MLRLLWLSIKQPAYFKRFVEQMGFFRWEACKKPVVAVHAVSMGEAQAAIPLLNFILNDYPHYQVVVTTTTPTGAASVKQQFGDRVRHIYLPHDIPYAVEQFITRIKPKLVIIMETEIWPYFYFSCGQQAIPIILANARLTKKSFNRYLIIKPLIYRALQSVACIAAQSQQDADYFRALGATPVRVCGNLKFDVMQDKRVVADALMSRQSFIGDRPVWIAASTHQGEEEIICEAHAQLLQQYPRLMLILVPRHDHRVKAVINICRRYGLSFVTRKSKQSIVDQQVFIVDSMGELVQFYAMADIAFVGGSLMNQGGHNILEPISMAIPVLCGPNVANIKQIVLQLSAIDVVQIVHTANEISAKITWLLDHKHERLTLGQKGQLILEQNKGVIQSVSEIVKQYL